MTTRTTCEHPRCDSAEVIRAAESNPDDWGPWWLCPPCTVALCDNVTNDDRATAGRFNACRDFGFTADQATALATSGYDVLTTVDLTAYSLTPVSSGLVEGDQQ